MKRYHLPKQYTIHSILILQQNIMAVSFSEERYRVLTAKPPVEKRHKNLFSGTAIGMA